MQGHSAIVYALYSAAGVILAFVAGSVFWKEPLTGRNWLGVAVAVAAVALLNLG
jgi:multidrug transporter EmrE-like cation transporter